MIKYSRRNRLLYSVIVLTVLDMVLTISTANAEGVSDVNNVTSTKNVYGKTNWHGYGNTNFCNRGLYMKVNNVTCCLKKTLKNPMPSLQMLRLNGQCAESMKEVDGDDLPTSIYREYRCFLNQNGATSEDLSSLQNYLKYMTQHYEDESVKSAILQHGEKCEGIDSSKDEVNRLMDYYNCLVLAETKVCHVPNNKTAETDATTFYTSHEEYCKRKNSSDSMTCCKGWKIPDNIHLHGGRPHLHHFSKLKSNQSSNIPKLNCMKSFRQRRDELYNASNAMQVSSNTTNSTIQFRCGTGSGTGSSGNTFYHPYYCSGACDVHQANYTSKTDLIVDFEAIKAFMFKSYTKTTQQELGNIFDKNMAKKLFILSDNSTVSLIEAAKWMESLDELSHIKMYCRLHDHVVYGTEHFTVNEYCLGEDWDKNQKHRIGGNNNVYYSHLFDLSKPSRD